MTAADPVLGEIMTTVALGHTGQAAEARAALDRLWQRIILTGDAFHRCTLAHQLADLQPDEEAELYWDEQALAAAGELTDQRLQRVDPGLTVAGFLPSLQLNLADVHRRLGHTDRARTHLAIATALVPALAEDAYGNVIRTGIDHVQHALNAGSTARLATHPSVRHGGDEE
jgi:hypothetical protein